MAVDCPNANESAPNSNKSIPNANRDIASRIKQITINLKIKDRVHFTANLLIISLSISKGERTLSSNRLYRPGNLKKLRSDSINHQ